MKVLKWIKWFFSIIILLVGLSGIIWGTTYVLKNNGIKKRPTKKETKIIEKVVANELSDNLSEIYNIYLNKEKHKVKTEYQLVSNVDGTKRIVLSIYFDGKNSLEREVLSLPKIDSIKEVFDLENVSENIRLNEKSFNILKAEEEYLLIDIGFIKESNIRYYYIINNNGDLLNDKGLLLRDSNKKYLYSNGEEFTSFYDENKSLAKIADDSIYALEEEEKKNKLNIVEYKYYIKDKKLKKDKIQTFEDMKIVLG